MKRLARGAVAIALLATALSGCELVAIDPLAQMHPADPLPRPDTTWLGLGRSLLDQDRPDLAHDAFVRSLRVEGVTATALTGAGVAAARQGLLREARRRFERAIEIEPDSAAAHNNLGAMLYELGELEAARHAFRSAFALSSGSSGTAARNLGIVDLAIRRAESEEPSLARNPLLVQRVGVAEYRLLERPDGGAQAQG